MEARIEGFSGLHDGTLDGVSLDWGTGLVRLAIRLESYQVDSVEIHAIETRSLVCPRREEWGRSSFINDVRGPNALPGGGVRLEVEMQSGDIIVIEAKEIRIISTCRTG